LELSKQVTSRPWQAPGAPDLSALRPLSTVAERIENGGARREPQANPMLKDRFDARCQRRRASRSTVVQDARGRPAEVRLVVN
jgi:hypothetical protein